MINFLKKQNYLKAFNSYNDLKLKNNLNRLAELRFFIEKNLIINNKDLFYNLFIKKILYVNYNQIFKSHLILYILNLKFNREFYNAYKGGVIKLSLPKNINEIINKFGIHTSILNSFFWKLSLLKKFLKYNLVIIKLLSFKKGNILFENFIYVFNNANKIEYNNSFKSNPYSNNYAWLANKFNCKTILIPNIRNKSNYEFGQYNVFKSNNFQFNRLYKLIIFLFTFLIKFIFAFFLIFTKYWHYSFMFRDIIENDCFILNSIKFDGKIFFDNNYAFERPLWTISSLINKNDVHLYFVSSNFEFIQLTNKCDIQHTGYHSMQWDNILVWDERQKNILNKFIKNPELQNIHIVGPIPYLSNLNISNKLVNNHKQNLILFDVQPYRFTRYLEIGWPNEYYLFGNVKKFYLNILDKVDFENTNVYYKRKRETKQIDKKYLNFLNNLKIQKKISEINCDQNIFNIFDDNKNIKVISMPFTGPSYVANHFGIKSSFYDPSGIIKNVNYDNLKVIKNEKDLDKFIND